MPRAFYENFDLVIRYIEAKKVYEASVLNAAGGDNTVSFSLNEAPEEVISAVTRHFNIALPTSTPTTTPGAGVAANRGQDIGKYLFESLFQNGMLAGLQLTLDRARGRNAFLRLRLNLTAVPELVGLPWEMLRSDTNDLALSLQTSVVRYQNVSSPQDEIIVKDKPLRILVVISKAAPPGAPPLNVEGEWDRINTALKRFIDLNLIKLERLEHATLDQLDNRFFDTEKPPLHIFHFIGHGGFNKEEGQGQLLFEVEPSDSVPPGAAGDIDFVSGDRLGQSLRNQSSLRLADLNASEGAMVSTVDSYAGVAQQLLLTGNVPIVVAMRRVISDDIAIAFAQTFYQWLLVQNLTVDAAMTRARLRMRDVEQKRIGSGKPAEWATPVLFMRNHDGYLVDFQDVPSPVVPVTLPDDVDPDMARHYQTVLNALTKGKLVPFLGLDVNLFGRAPIAGWEPATSALLPGYLELVGYLAKLSRHPIPFIPALADVSQYALLHSPDEGTFYDELGNIFTKGAVVPSELHQFWARVAAHHDELTGATERKPQDVSQRFLIVCSTYDNLLETSFKTTLDRFHVVTYIGYGEHRGKFRHTPYVKAPGTAEPVPQGSTIIEVATSYAALYDPAPVILKIPGTVGDALGLRFAITEDQYLDFFSRRELASILPSQLLTKLRNSNQLFLGYNVREWWLRALLYRIWEDHTSPFASWAVLDQASAVQLRYWEACKVTPIERELENYLKGLRLSCRKLLPGVEW